MVDGGYVWLVCRLCRDRNSNGKMFHDWDSMKQSGHLTSYDHERKLKSSWCTACAVSKEEQRKIASQMDELIQDDPQRRVPVLNAFNLAKLASTEDGVEYQQGKNIAPSVALKPDGSPPIKTGYGAREEMRSSNASEKVFSTCGAKAWKEPEQVRPSVQPIAGKRWQPALAVSTAKRWEAKAVQRELSPRPPGWSEFQTWIAELNCELCGTVFSKTSDFVEHLVGNTHKTNKKKLGNDKAYYQIMCDGPSERGFYTVCYANDKRDLMQIDGVPPKELCRAMQKVCRGGSPQHWPERTRVMSIFDRDEWNRSVRPWQLASRPGASSGFRYWTSNVNCELCRETFSDTSDFVRHLAGNMHNGNKEKLGHDGVYYQIMCDGPREADYYTVCYSNDERDLEQYDEIPPRELLTDMHISFFGSVPENWPEDKRLMSTLSRDEWNRCVRNQELQEDRGQVAV